MEIELVCVLIFCYWLLYLSQPCNVVACPDELPPVAAASMWMRKDVKEFKDSLKNDHESVLKVGSGEIVTVSELYVQSGIYFIHEYLEPSVHIQ